MDLSAKRAIQPPRATVLRTRLEPLCFAHLYALMRWAPSILEADKMQLRDLLIGTLICAHKGADGEELVGRTSTSRLMSLWGWRCRKLNVPEQAECFVKYIRDSINVPPLMVSPNGRKLCSHWLLQSHGLALQLLHLSYQDSLSLPVAWILYEITALREIEGKVELWPQDMEDFWQEVTARQQAKVRN